MKRFRIKSFSLLLCLLTNICFSYADEGHGRTTAFKIKKVSLFKNGFGFFVSESELPRDRKSIEFGQIPIPTLGTFWVDYPKTLKVKGLFTSMKSQEDITTVQSVIDILETNIGKRVTVITNMNGNVSFTGIIENVSMPGDENNGNPYIMGSTVTSPKNPATGIVLLKTEKGVVALQKSTILSAEFENDKVKTTSIKNEKSPSLRMELEEHANGEIITMNYLAGGITWSPGYRIDLSDPKQALFSANAVIINEVTDLKNVEINLVTGYPNVKYANVFSPVAMGESLSEYLDALNGRGHSSRQRGNRTFAFSNQEVYGYLDNPTPVYIMDESGGSGTSQPEKGTVSEDLFLYPLKNIDIKKNETACVKLFSMNVPSEHIYIWNIKDLLNKEEYYDRNRNNQIEKDTIWHVVRLTNTMNVPWTTAPCEFVNKEQITGQDVCYYTPVGGKATIHINHAINISTDKCEYEIKRDRSAKNFNGRDYDLVSIEGHLNMNSKLDKTVTIEISKLLTGNVLKTEPKAADVKIATGLKEINTNHKVVWSLELKPGEDKKLVYNYEVYVRN